MCLECSQGKLAEKNGSGQASEYLGRRIAPEVLKNRERLITQLELMHAETQTNHLHHLNQCAQTDHEGSALVNLATQTSNAQFKASINI